MRIKKLSFGWTAVLAIFALSLLVTAARAAAQTETVLYSFSSPSGYAPSAGLAFDAAGNLYGATTLGGTLAFAPGTVFQLTPSTGGGWTPTFLKDFGSGQGGPTGVILDAAGDLYFATAGGGAKGAGVVFELTPQAGGGWSEKRLHQFGQGTDGVGPSGPLVFDSAGNLYGTTYGGGVNGGLGTVFELIPGATGVWTEKVLYSFGSASTDGTHPFLGNLVLDAAGNVYGTTTNGGLYGQGTVFQLTHAGGGWAERILHNFGQAFGDGQRPESGLVFDSAGNLYGTTSSGGAGAGTVFELMPQANGRWAQKILDQFQNLADGAYPWGGLIFDAAGNLYGTTLQGGSGACSLGCGTVFKLTPNPRGGWTEVVLHNFGSGTDGIHPYDSLIFDASGNLYGTTHDGGAYGGGTVFEITP